MKEELEHKLSNTLTAVLIRDSYVVTYRWVAQWCGYSVQKGMITKNNSRMVQGFITNHVFRMVLN